MVVLVLILCPVTPTEARKTQQSTESKEAQSHYHAGLAAVEKNDLAAAEEEMQAAAKLSPKDALIRYKLAMIQSKRGDWQHARTNLDAAMELGVPEDLKAEADDLLAGLMLKKMQARESEANKKYAWLDQMKWLDGKWFYMKDLYHDSECAKDYHTIDNVLKIGPDPYEGVFSGTLNLWELHRITKTGAAAGCSKVKSSEVKRTLILRVVIKPDDGINDGQMRMFATFESCEGNGCDTIDRKAQVLVVKKGEDGPVISLGALSDGDKDGRIAEEFGKQE
jgi:tetratricopeptide (TPR) repeat protein